MHPFFDKNKGDVLMGLGLTTVFLDWDDTLIDFSVSEKNALTRTMAAFGTTLTAEMLARYSELNLSCWKRFERGEMEKSRVYLERYELLFAEYGLPYDPVAFNARYLSELSEEVPAFDGAEDLCRLLHKRYDVYVVTNGDRNGQFRRIAKSGLEPYFDGVFVSERIGVGKPKKAYWDYVFAHIRETDASRTMIVGDSLTSDMASADTVPGMKTCWVNPHGKKTDRILTWEVKNLRELISRFSEEEV